MAWLFTQEYTLVNENHLEIIRNLHIKLTFVILLRVDTDELHNNKMISPKVYRHTFEDVLHKFRMAVKYL